MQTVKSYISLIRAFVPVIYCGGLAWYFFGVGGSVRGVEDIGLGPTVIGLGAVSLLFCVPLVLKIIRFLARPRSPGSGGHGGSNFSTPEDDDGSSADAAIARYMAQRPTEDVPAPAPSRPKGSGPAKRTGFGRRTA